MELVCGNGAVSERMHLEVQNTGKEHGVIERRGIEKRERKQKVVRTEMVAGAAAQEERKRMMMRRGRWRAHLDGVLELLMLSLQLLGFL